MPGNRREGHSRLPALMHNNKTIRYHFVVLQDNNVFFWWDPRKEHPGFCSQRHNLRMTSECLAQKAL